MSHMNVSEVELAKEKFVAQGKELIHIEADIHALEGVTFGFGAGEWIPYMEVDFALFPEGKKDAILKGKFMPMVAKDGPHYGTTIRMPGKGKYRLEYSLSTAMIARHTDPVTGVSEFWKPFTVSFDFEYKGFDKSSAP
jgi:periplasmic iron binding protein